MSIPTEAFAKAIESANINLGRSYRDAKPTNVYPLRTTGEDNKPKVIGAYVECTITMYVSAEEARLHGLGRLDEFTETLDRDTEARR